MANEGSYMGVDPDGNLLEDIPSDYDDDGHAPAGQFMDNLGSYMSVAPDDWIQDGDNEGSYLGVDPDGNPGSYMSVDPHAKQFVGGGGATGRKKKPAPKKASNPGSYMAVDPGDPGSYMEMAPDADVYDGSDGNPGSYMSVDPHAKQFVGGGGAKGRKKVPKKKGTNPGSYMAVDPNNPGSYMALAPDEDEGSYMAVDPHTGAVVKKKRGPRRKETDVEFEAKRKEAQEQLAKIAASNPGSYMELSPDDDDENSYMAVDPHTGRTGRKRRDPRTGEVTWEFPSGLKETKGNEGSYIAMEPDFCLDDDIDVSSFLSKRGKGQNYSGENSEWIQDQHMKLSKQPWFKGDIGRGDATKMLTKKARGSFVIRASQSQPGTYAISVVDKGKVDHMLVLPSYAGDDSPAPGATMYRFGTKTKEMFNTVPKLVAYYIGHEMKGTDGLKLNGEVLAEEQAGGFLAVTQEEEDLGSYLAVSPDEVIEEDVMKFIEKAKKKGAKDKKYKGEKDQQWLEQQHKMLESQPWFKPNLSRGNANRELFRKPEGTFIVRPSTSRPGHYACSFVENGAVDHMLVLPSYAGGDPNIPGATRYRFGTKSKNLFNTIPKLIAYYIGHPYLNGRKLKGYVVKEEQDGGFCDV